MCWHKSHLGREVYDIFSVMFSSLNLIFKFPFIL